MENLKVKASSEAESKEAQELFFELGYDWFKKGYVEVKTPETIMAFENGALTTGIRGSINHKEITLPELRDLVVLRRNDRNDRTHTDQDNWSWFISSNGTGYVFGAGNANGLHQWDESSLNMVDLKPIEKPMKEPKQAEFLVKTDSGYVLQVLDENAGGADVVRIPDGAEIAILASGVVYFWKSHFFNGGVNKDWVDMKEGWDASWYLKSLPSAITIWQRETLNDQVASAEEYREIISNASILGRSSVVVDIAQSCSGGASRNASPQDQSDFPLNNYELNHRVAKAFNAVRGTNLNEDDVNYIRELINLTISHYGERK